jgi:hypothetical protein
MTDLAFEIAEQSLDFAIEEAAPLSFEVSQAAGLTFETKESVLGFDTTENLLSFQILPPEPITFEVANLALAPNPEDVMPPVYATRTDFVSSSLAYVGEAVPGTLDSAPAWRIKRLTIAADDDVTTEWADGNANFDNAWADRLTLSYS